MQAILAFYSRLWGVGDHREVESRGMWLLK